VKTVHLLLTPGFADWEAAFAIAELRRSGGWRVAAVGVDPGPVTSMGGLRVTPDVGLQRVDLSHSSMVILPGGDAWLEGERPDVSRQLKQAASVGLPVAAICGAVVALAHAGLLDDRDHTGNELAELERHAPRYQGAKRFKPDSVVERDRGVITAPGTRPVDFAAAIFEALGLFPGRVREYRALFGAGAQTR